ncbi:MAG: hypothetical protein ACJ8GJ_22810 [Vitreoscilla sp.]
MLALIVPLAGAQTIADYSRAQSAWLESTMSQAAARSAGLGASAPAVVVPTSPAASAPAPAPRMTMLATAPAVQVSGIFASRAGAVAEVVVNATAYLLGAGQDVPGTAWHVETIGVEKVVLGRAGASGLTGTEGARRVFPLPALH